MLISCVRYVGDEDILAVASRILIGFWGSEISGYGTYGNNGKACE